MADSAFTPLAPLEPLMDKCVHCGFCLPSCPSYLLLGQEMDSPRGRIYLMRAGVEGRIAMTPAVVRHFDTCLGCMACETACPSGVRYAPLIEHTRAAVETHHQRTLADRLFRTALFRVLPYPARLRALSLPLAVARWIASKPRVLALLPERIRSLTALSRALPEHITAETLPERTSPAGPVRARVALLTGCVQQTFFGHVN